MQATKKTRVKRIRRRRRRGGELRAKAPHSGYHYDGLPRRFFEGWYFKVSLPGGDAFAFMYSVEDPALAMSADRGVGVQVMGPGDTYLCEYARDTRGFSADTRELALSHVFGTSRAAAPIEDDVPPHERFVDAETFLNEITTGAVVTKANQHCGRIRSKVTRAEDVIGQRRSDTSVAAGLGPSSSASSDDDDEEECIWSFTIEPRVSYGRSTGGWLSSVPLVFDPHWQVLISDGVVVNGFITWRGETYSLGPSNRVYAEKNWGGSFPTKWFWVQCNSCWTRTQSDEEGDADQLSSLAVTAGGGVRQLPLTATREDVALITVHADGEVFEFVPWRGAVGWEITQWGEWTIDAETRTQDGRELHASLTASTDGPGVVLCAPASDGGLRPMCRDAFRGRVRLRIVDTGTGRVVIDASSIGAALEVGGGPWFGTWKSESNMSEALRAILNLPIVDQLSTSLPSFLLPPGL